MFTNLLLVMIRSVLILFVAAVFTSGCGNDSADGSLSASAAQTGNTVYDDSLTPCELLTADIVASEAGIDAGDVNNPVAMSRICTYNWDNGWATLSWVYVYDSAERAREVFEEEHRERTPEEEAASRAALAEGLEERRAEGELTDEEAALGQMLGGMAADMIVTEQKVSIDGVGDQAIYGWGVEESELSIANTTITTYSVSSRLYVLDGNMRFEVEGHPAQYESGVRPSDDMLEANRAFTIALAQRVLAEAR